MISTLRTGEPSRFWYSSHHHEYHRRHEVCNAIFSSIINTSARVGPYYRTPLLQFRTWCLWRCSWWKFKWSWGELKKDEPSKPASATWSAMWPEYWGHRYAAPPARSHREFGRSENREFPSNPRMGFLSGCIVANRASSMAHLGPRTSAKRWHVVKR